MSKLPPALAARLAKRGLLDKPSTGLNEQEEVIAEDYDDLKTTEVTVVDTKIYDTVRGCPNKYNIYHNCSSHCVKRYSNVAEEAPIQIRKRFKKLLQKYPIYDSIWEQIYDPGLKTYYFWNTETDQVSWLPPSHPDSKISMPAEKLRKLLREDVVDDNESVASDDDDDEEESADDSDDSDESSDSSDRSNSDDSIKRKRKQIVKRNNLDPMDPAAYSNIPRGKWSDGLNNRHDN